MMIRPRKDPYPKSKDELEGFARRQEMIERQARNHDIRFMSDGDDVGLTYKKFGVTVVWPGGPLVYLVSQHWPPKVIPLVGYGRGYFRKYWAICEDADDVFSPIVERYLVEMTGYEAANDA